MKPILRSNKGVSDLVAYVLLISLTLSIAAAVYGWLVFIVPQQNPECPDGVNVIVKEYTCTPKTGAGTGKIEMVVQNKGLFSVDGFIVRASDNVNSTFGVNVLGKVEDKIVPGTQTDVLTYPFGTMGNLTVLEVQPFIDENKQRILCKGYTVMQINCTNVVSLPSP